MLDMGDITGLLSRQWRFPDEADEAALGRVWRAAAAEGLFQPADAREALAVCRAAGAAGCPLPVMDGFVAAGLVGRRSGTGAGIAAGDVRVLVVASGPAGISVSPTFSGASGAFGPADEADDTVPFAEAGAAASHVLVLPPGGGPAMLRPVEFAVPQPGMARPAWARLHLGTPELVVDVTAGQAAEAFSLLRLGLAARAMAAAGHTHRQSLAHAKVRRQFGQTVGGFGAVQQRAATQAIDLAAGELLADDAARRHVRGSADRVLATELAVAHAVGVASRIQIGSQHTLGAGGYFEGHDGPWFFRRVHADIALAATYPASQGTVADLLIEGGFAALPAVDSAVAAAAMREQVGALCAEFRVRERSFEKGDEPELVAAASARRWFGITWPDADGGRAATLVEQLALQEETAYHQLPVANALASVSVVGAPMVKYGSASQKAEYLPRIREGRLSFCLGYSEPEAGSDLASLTTTATRDGDGWVIDGTKAWITNAPTAEYIWLAVRTDPDASLPLAGISMFMVPMATPGIRTESYRALSGQVCGSVFFEGVRVGGEALIGPLNRGWQVITDTLTEERLLLAAELAGLARRQLDELLAVVRADPAGVVGAVGSEKRARVGDIAVQVQAVRLLLNDATAKTGVGPAHVGRMASAMAGVLAAETAERLSRDALGVVGPAGMLASGDAPGGGVFEHGLRVCILAFLGGGTNDVQRGLIARGLGLN